MKKGDIVKPLLFRVSSNCIRLSNLEEAEVLTTPQKAYSTDKKKLVALEILSTRGLITEIDNYPVRSIGNARMNSKSAYGTGDTIIVYEDCLTVLKEKQETQDVPQTGVNKEYAPSNYTDALKCLILTK